MCDTRDEIIYHFEEEIFPHKDNAFKTKEKESKESKLEKIKDDYKNFFKYIEDESKDISHDGFKEYFNFEVPSALAKKLYEPKGKKKNNDLVELIKVRWSNLKDDI